MSIISIQRLRERGPGIAKFEGRVDSVGLEKVYINTLKLCFPTSDMGGGSNKNIFMLCFFRPWLIIMLEGVMGASNSLSR